MGSVFPFYYIFLKIQWSDVKLVGNSILVRIKTYESSLKVTRKNYQKRVENFIK